MTAVLLLCGVFVLLNGLFVAAEFAVVGAPKAAIEHRAGTGDRLAERLLRILESPHEQDRYIATSQLGITVASLGLGMYGEPLVAALLRQHIGNVSFLSAEAISGALALAVLTLAHIVFGEIVPKSLVLRHAEQIARLAYWPIRTTFMILYPLVRSLSGIAGLCLRLLGVRRQETGHEQFYTPEELQLIVKESEKSGAIRAESGRLLHELFEFGDLTASEAMRPRVRVIGIPSGASPAEIRTVIAEGRHTRYPVFTGNLDHIAGVVHVKDLLRRLVANQPLTVYDVAPMPVVPETALLDDVLTTMQKASAHVAVVVDEHGGTAGLISIEDLFEEVVGDIDEGTVQPAGLVPLADGSVRAAGTLRLDELGQHFDLALEHEQVDSVSGLVLAVLGRPPLVGDVIEYGRLRLEVVSLSGLGVQEVHASLVSSGTGA